MPFNDFERGLWWDADQNIPKLLSGMGEPGLTYEVSVPGTTELDGISSWQVGDIIYFTNPSRKWIKLYPSGGAATPLTVSDEGTPVDTNVTLIDFVGDGVTVTESVPGSVTVTIPGGAAPTINYDLGFYAEAPLETFEVFGRYVFPTDMGITGSGSVASADLPATAETVITLWKNGVQFGTVTYAASSATGAVAATPTQFTAGDVFYIMGPEVPDSTLAQIAVTLVFIVGAP